MARFPRTLLPVVLLAALLTLPGCAQTSARTTFSFQADGSFTQSLSVSSLALTDDMSTTLTDAGWQVTSEGGVTASREFESTEAYGAQAGVLYSALAQSFTEQAGWNPGIVDGVTVKRTVTDYLLFQRQDVEISVPLLDLAPDECPTCTGSGIVDCPDCDDGTEECDECGGSGRWEGWLGWEDCWQCDGTGRAECWTCDGGGGIFCDDCGGSGDAPEWVEASYTDALDDSKLQVEIEMPGLFAQSSDGGEPSWSLRGGEIEDADVFAAHSYVVDWLYAGIAAAVVLLLLAIAVALMVRGIKRRGSRKVAAPAPVPAEAAAPAPVAAPAPAPAPAAPVVSDAPAYCTACGAPLGTDARFCTRCGSATGKGVS